MRRAGRMLMSGIFILLILLEAAPSHPRVGLRAATGHECAISATVQPVSMVALPFERATSPADTGGFERTPLSPFAFVAVESLEQTMLARAAHAVVSRGGERFARKPPRRSSARAPDDPDPF